MAALGFHPTGMELPPTDFVMMAKSLGADAILVEQESELDRALDLAMEAKGPFVVDVLIDPAERSPMGSRIKQLKIGGGGTTS